jgi:hypothetical protein
MVGQAASALLAGYLGAASLAASGERVADV